MRFYPTKIVSLFLIVFCLILNLSCSKDSDLFSEVIADDIEKNVESANEESSDETEESNLVSITTILIPKQDAYIQGAEGIDTDIVRIDGDFRKSYLLFDLSNINGEINNAQLTFTISQDSGNGTIEVHKGSSTDWTEDNLGAGNAPTETTMLGSTEVGFEDSSFQINLSHEDIASEPTSFILLQRSGNDMAVASKENIQEVVPKLTLTYMGDPNNVDSTEDNNDNSGDTDSNNEEDINENTDTTEEEEEEEENFDNNNRSGDTNYFVSLEGDNSNDGLSEGSSFRSIQRAIDMAQPGDIVWVKAANYGDINIFSRRHGTSSKPIKIIGYTNAPNDIVSDVFSTYTKADFDANGGVLPNNIMPLIETDRGSDNNPNPDDRAFNIDHDYIHIENFMAQYQEYSFDVDTPTRGVEIINCVSNETGNWDPSNPNWMDPTTFPEPNGNLNGVGVRIVNGTNAVIKNCIVFNSGHVGIEYIGSNNSLMENNRVYATKDGNPPDYHQLLYSSNNITVKNFESYRVSGISHPSRGFDIKCRSYSNTIEGGYIENMRLRIYRDSDDNVVRDVTLQGSGNPFESEVSITSGSDRNILYNIKMFNGGGINFRGGDQECDGSANGDVGNDNYFINPIIKNPTSQNNAFIDFGFQYGNGNAGTNYIIGGTFDGAPNLFRVDRPVTSIYLINCSISNISDGFYDSREREGFVPNEVLINCNFYNCNFSTPNGTNITTFDPMYVDPFNNDYRLQSNSRLIGAGIDATSYEPSSNIDHNNQSRSQNSWDVGAYQN